MTRSLSSSGALALHGRQEPRLLTLPDRSGSKLDELLDLLFLINVGVDPWQEQSLDAILSVDHEDLWSCTEFGELVARQNGKGNIILPYELGHLFLWPREDGEPKLIVHTAHEFKTAREAFRRIERVIRSSPLLIAQLKGGVRGGISTSHGEEGFELKDGTRLRFLARSKNSGVGFTCDVLVVDEGQQTPLAAMDALLPTMSSVPNHQILFTGTVPDELDDSEYFEGVRDRGRAASDRRSGWIEFSPDGSDDPDVAAALDITDRTFWEHANPALGIRMKAEAIEDELSRLSRDSFLRERLSVWPNRRPDVAVRLSELDIGRWKDSKDPEAAVSGDQAVIAIALGRGGGFGTVAAASRFDDDQIAVEHKQTDRQTRWIAPYVRDLKAELGDALVVLDPKNASSIVNDLDKLGVKYLAMNMNEIAGAHAGFIEDVNAGLVPHRDQAEVTASLELATTRKIGAAGVTWEPSDPTKPITHAQAVTWAHWGVKKREAASPRKPAVVRGYS